MIEIKNRYSGAVLFCFTPKDGETCSVKEAVVSAVKTGASLRDADLSGADLIYADLSDADLRGADLSGADLSGANLSYANLSGADLRGADLSYANLSGADLRGADLSYADLRGADLSYANLIGADLSGADLSGADLRGEKLKIAPIYVLRLIWNVLITPEFMVIGCQRHSHESWSGFDASEISRMESRAPEFWATNKAFLLAACDAHKAAADKIEV